MRDFHRNSSRLKVFIIAAVLLFTACTTEFKLATVDGGIQQATDDIQVDSECDGGDAACEPSSADSDATSTEADAGPDTASDTGTETVSDAGTDTASDTGTETVSDAGTDTASDTGTDTAGDTSTDTASDIEDDTETGSDSDNGLCPAPPYECKNPTACKNTGGEILEEYGCLSPNSVCCSYL